MNILAQINKINQLKPATMNNGFRLFKIKKSGISYIAFVYGEDYSDQLSEYISEMRFEVDFAGPKEWAHDMFNIIRKYLLAYEISTNWAFFPVYAVPAEVDVWNIIHDQISEFNKEYLNNN